MRVRGPDQDRLRGDTGAFPNGLPNLLDCVPADPQGIDSDHRDPIPSVVEHGGSHLAGVVERSMVRLSVAPGFLHADVRRDVPLGETRLESDGRRSLAGNGTRQDQ